MTNIENKTAYPYITEFKKEPFKSFLTTNRKEIGNFYLSNYEKVLELYQYYNESLLNETSLNLENIYWFLLLRKYIKQKVDVFREDFLNFIKGCEVEIIEKDHLGFKSSPNTLKKPDIWSMYYALASLELLGILNEYLSSKGQDVIVRKIKNFIYHHKRNNGFLHCHDKSCEECNNGPVAKTFYYVTESLLLIGIDVRVFKEQFRSYLKERKKDSSILYKLLSLKFFDLDSEVRDKEIQFLYQFQKENGGFSFIYEDVDVDTTFWVVNILHIYSWLIDYNPARIYSFITEKLDYIFREITSWNLKIQREVTQLVILLSIIWNRFIEEIERVIFKHLETKSFIDLNQIKNTFGLSHGLEEIVLYINLNYTFTLKKVDNTLEFNQYIQNLSQGKKVIIQEIYEQLNDNSVISLSDIFKKYRGSYINEPLRLKEDIFPIIHDLISNHFFEGEIRAKKAYLFKTKYYLCLDYLFKNILIVDNEINVERLYEEKSKIKEIRNDIYNMTLKLKNTVPHIREEIESYLLIDEVDFAKERLKYILRDSLMEADFLNENIESSFNQELIYINLQATLGAEISQWSKSYSLLQNELNELNSYLQERIQEKESLKKFNIILDELDTRIYDIQDQINREVDSFKNYIVEVLDKGYNHEKFDLIIQAFNRISQSVSKYDGVIYKYSHQVTSKEKKIAKNHKKVINKWIEFKENFDSIFADYTNGFQFFNELNNNIGNVKDNIQNGILTIKENAKNQVANNQYQDAFKTIKMDSDILLKQKTDEIHKLKQIVKKNTSFKQKLFPLYKYLNEKLDSLEENIIDLIADQEQILKEKVIEERKRAKVEDFDNFVSNTIQIFKDRLEKYKFSIDQNRVNKIPDVISGFDTINIEFNNNYKKFSKKLITLDEIVDNPDESSIKVIQWEKFNEFLNNEINKLKDEYVNKIISNEIYLMSEEENTDKIDIKKLADKLKLKCKTIIPRIKDMIEVSKLQGDLLEDKKELIVHSEAYHKNKELKNFTENRILKQTQDTIGQLLALYDSCIKNKTLGVNLLEIQNRINDMSDLKGSVNNKYNVKIKELNVDEKRIENIELSNNISAIVNNNELALEKIKENLELFKDLESFMVNEYNALKIDLENIFTKVTEDIEKVELYGKMKEILDSKKEKVELKLKQVDDKIEEKLKIVINKTFESRKFETEAREFYFEKKNEIKKLVRERVGKIEETINTLKLETDRGELLSIINKNNIHLSQLLGTLQARVEDYIETEQFKRAYLRVNKKHKYIEQEIRNSNKRIYDIYKTFNRNSNDFETKNKHIINDFDRFIKEFNEILREKVKTLEELIVKSYVEMAVKAVANEFLTLSFLQNELKMKKQLIQKHLISLISAGKLSGKYDPQIGLYYENSEVLKSLDENELEVIKKMNFRVYMFMRRLRNLTNQYGSIIAFFASIITISYYLFRISGENPLTIMIPIFLTLVVLAFLLFKKKKDEKI
ncbi:MAG: hypothetical protein HWN80_06840 [Candidatus Lokiarchaeota archaeon]|nr:hypothetical protein [Candidatus Lokiarchaeota archaeon]